MPSTVTSSLPSSPSSPLLCSSSLLLSWPFLFALWLSPNPSGSSVSLLSLSSALNHVDLNPLSRSQSSCRSHWHRDRPQILTVERLWTAWKNSLGRRVQSTARKRRHYRYASPPCLPQPPPPPPPSPTILAQDVSAVSAS